MDGIKKRGQVIILAVIMMFMLIVPATQAATDVGIVINGQAITFPDQKPYIDTANRTMVPVRAPMEAIGCIVDWDADKQQAILTKDGVVAIFTIGSSTYSVNGAARTMDTQAVIAGNRTAFPIRFAAEAMGATVGWDAETYTVIISTQPTQTGIVQATPEQVTALKSYWQESWWEAVCRISPTTAKHFDDMTAEETEIAWKMLDTGIIRPGQTFVASKETACRVMGGAYVVRGYLTIIENGQPKTYAGAVRGEYEDGQYQNVHFYSQNFIGKLADAVPEYRQDL